MSVPDFGEDVWLAERGGQYAAEVGAWDGQTGSITERMEAEGWTVLCVEPNPRIEAHLRSARRNVVSCACGKTDEDGVPFHIHDDCEPSFSSLRPKLDSVIKPEDAAKWSVVTVNVRTLTRLLDEAKFPRLDALSVDTEGTELDVLEGLDFDRFKPLRICCESWTDATPCTKFLESKGYALSERRNVNNLYDLR